MAVITTNQTIRFSVDEAEIDVRISHDLQSLQFNMRGVTFSVRIKRDFNTSKPSYHIDASDEVQFERLKEPERQTRATAGCQME